MTSTESHSLVEINIGQNAIRLEGTEEFLADELDTILDRVDLSVQVPTENVPEVPSENGSGPERDEMDDAESEDGEGADAEEAPLEAVAQRLPNVEVDQLSAHFYVDDDGVHIKDPMSIESKYAFLGYCTIREIMAGEQYHDNTETKRKLIDDEKVNIKSWGGNFLYNLRQNGLIKDDPQTDMKRNKPFKITPTGREEFVNWLTG